MAEQDARSTSQVLKDATTNLQALVRSEVDLAKAEVGDGVAQMVRGIALLVVGGVFGLFVLAFAGVTAAVALENVVAPWLAWLIVTLVVTLVLAVCALLGTRQLKKADPAPTQTKATIQETVEWARTQLQR